MLNNLFNNSQTSALIFFCMAHIYRATNFLCPLVQASKFQAIQSCAQDMSACGNNNCLHFYNFPIQTILHVTHINKPRTGSTANIYIPGNSARLVHFEYLKRRSIVSQVAAEKQPYPTNVASFLIWTRCQDERGDNTAYRSLDLKVLTKSTNAIKN